MAKVPPLTLKQLRELPQPINVKTPPPADPWPAEPHDPWPEGGLGLAPLKTEGAAMPYDFGAGPGVPLTRWGRLVEHARLAGRRLRYLPDRLWWAFFGDEYY